MKTRLIHTVEEADELIHALSRSACHAISNFEQRARESSGLHALWAAKFLPIGCDPLDPGRPLNLMEQINQTFTYLASAKALKAVMMQHPTLGPFTLNLGTASGSDIESGDGVLAAEVFAAVNTSNNQKLARDIQKVQQTTATYKYVFSCVQDTGQEDSTSWNVGQALRFGR